MDRDEAIAELRRVRRQRERAENARTAAAKATRAAIVAALKAEIGPSEIAAECGVTDSHVRAVRRGAQIPANPSYAALKPPVRTKAPAPGASAQESAPFPAAIPAHAPVAADIAGLPRPHIDKLAAEIKKRQGAQWINEVRDLHPADDPELWSYRIVEHARDAGLVPERDLYPQEP
jgi:hypothetical protein